MRDKKKNKVVGFLFFSYHFISVKELRASTTQVSKITSKILEHQIEVFDEKHQPKQNGTVQRGWGSAKKKKKKGSKNFTGLKAVVCTCHLGDLYYFLDSEWFKSRMCLLSLQERFTGERSVSLEKHMPK